MIDCFDYKKYYKYVWMILSDFFIFNILFVFHKFPDCITTPIALSSINPINGHSAMDVLEGTHYTIT